ncbi:hypothetical protein PYJP_10750 [Pyrofollis japonicus]|uniref:uroporphyrinogen-III synthase n=1 Tax=Pyrofollis japonicus TaxID=3060460 RepID=UPI00295A78A2|nr:uroporphyrinogen-III synthase [Pyrofollis japonicus]BEP17723.1 hypothetical protein PYJP_10750 [Pyrofollis japonicus]
MPRDQPLVLLLRPHPVEPGPLAEAAIVATIPVLRVVPSEESITKIAALLDKCDWLVLTSPRAPAMLKPILGKLRSVVKSGLRIAVVGPKTAQKLREELGLEAVLQPREYMGKVLAGELVRLKPRCVLLARSEKANPELARILKENNIQFIEVPLYTVEPIDDACEAAARIADLFDYVVFTSPSVVDAFMAKYGRGKKPREATFIPVAIGPTTAKRLASHGFTEVLVPDEYTLSGVTRLVKSHWAAKIGGK